MLFIVGLGTGRLSSLPLGAYRKLKTADRVFFQTKAHPAVQELEKEGVEGTFFDSVYQSAESGEVIYNQLADEVIDSVNSGGDLVYAVSGHPLVAEASVHKIINQLSGEEYEVIPAPSFRTLIYKHLELKIRRDPLKIIDGLNLTSADLDPGSAAVVSQVCNQRVALEIKTALKKVYPDNYQIKVIENPGLKTERIREIPLSKLEQLEEFNQLTLLYLPPYENALEQFNQLVKIMDTLRSKEGCPWDREQDYESLKSCLLEETYEVIERIDNQDHQGLEEELGDLLLQVVFLSQIAKEEGSFTIYDVITGLINKLIRRHPHVFREKEVENAGEAIESWEEIKEKTKEDSFTSILEEIPLELPALLQAQEIQAKASKVGFDWADQKGVQDKIEEEMQEFIRAVEKNSLAEQEEEFGDLLFSLVNLARFMGIEAEVSLLKTINKFRARFSYVEKELSNQGRELEKVSLSDLDKLWEQAKGNYKGRRDKKSE